MRDRDVRAALHQQVLRMHLDTPNTLVLDEFGLLHGRARIDVAVVNGELHGFELKSERDTLQRLPAQMAAYNAVFDRVTIVVAENHVISAAAAVPEWWGLVVARGNAQETVLHDHRNAEMNPAIDPMALAMLLWRDEALAAAEQLGISKGLSGKPRRFVHERLAVALEIDALRALVRSTLKNRAGWRVAGQRTSSGDSSRSGAIQ